MNSEPVMDIRIFDTLRANVFIVGSVWRLELYKKNRKIVSKGFDTLELLIQKLVQYSLSLTGGEICE